MLSARSQTPIMKASGNVEYPAHIVVCPESALVFDNAETFGTADSMFHTDYSRRYILVLSLLLRRKLSAFWLLCRLHDHGICRSVSLITGILPKLAQKRKIILCVSDCLVVYGTRDSLSNKKNDGCHRGYDRILDGMFLFLSAVIFFLFVGVIRTRNLSFRAIVKKNMASFCSSLQEASRSI